jgi:tol-pal system protein YbgF
MNISRIKQRTLQVFLASCCFCLVLAPHTNAQKKTIGSDRAGSTDISGVIADSALVKTLLLDLQFNVVGIGWNQRAPWGIGESVLTSKISLLFKKYNIPIEALKGNGPSVDTAIVNGAIRGQWNGGEQRAHVTISLPDEWLEVLHLSNWGRLPETKFKSGQIALSITRDLMVVHFEKGTMCQVKGTTYVYSDGKWRFELSGQSTLRDSGESVVSSVENSLYDSSMARYRAQHYREAAIGFEKFSEQYPKSSNAGEARFWAGECYTVLKEFHKAILAYQAVITGYPDGDKVPDSLYKQAHAFLELQDTATAKIILMKLRNQYPDSSFATIAGKELLTMK